MKNSSLCIAIVLAMTVALTGQADEKQQPVRMGCGLMTFDTVPGWGLRPDGHSAIGPTHGAVVIDKSGNVYTSANKGVFVFSPDGKLIHSYLGEKYSNIHDLEIRDEKVASLSTALATTTPKASSLISRRVKSY